MDQQEMMPILFRAVLTAKEAYNTSTEPARLNGTTPYWVHAEDVARIASGLWIQRNSDGILTLALVAWGHDIFENNPQFPLEQRWLADGVPPTILSTVITSIEMLSRKPEESYLQYLLRIKESSWLVHTIKRADIIANYQDTQNISHEGTRKGLRTKAELAFWILFSEELSRVL